MGREVIDCFADSPDVVLDWLEGTWLGKNGVERYFARAVRGENPPGFTHQLMPTGGIITVAPDRKTAKGRWYAFGAMFTPKEDKVSGSFVNGIYEMGYIKENGVWKILTIKWTIPYVVRIPEGWVMPGQLGRRSEEDRPGTQFEGPRADIAMDRDNDIRYLPGHILPFHFKHPVTGRATSEDEMNTRLKK